MDNTNLNSQGNIPTNTPESQPEQPEPPKLNINFNDAVRTGFEQGYAKAKEEFEKQYPSKLQPESQKRKPDEFEERMRQREEELGKNFEKQMKEKEATINILLDRTKETELLKIASQKNVHNPMDIVEALRNRIKISLDGKTEFLDAQGLPIIYDETGKHMTIDTLVNEYIKNRPYLVKASGNTGTGGQNTNIGSRPLTMDYFREMIQKDPAWYEKNRDVILEAIDTNKF